MQYRHAFHAGNFADVHKHIALLQLLTALKHKPKGFLYFDTHAGGGLYDLGSREARQSAEGDSGFLRLEATAAAGALPPAIRQYLVTVQDIRQAAAQGRTLYPGSPLLAAATLRAADSMLCVESQAPVSRALQRALAAGVPTAATRPRVHHGDGYRELRAHLPPASRRGLVLIDPPYEAADEERQITATLHDALERFETGVFAIWYPIKKRHDSDLWLARSEGFRPHRRTQWFRHAGGESAVALRCRCGRLATSTGTAAGRQRRQPRALAGTRNGLTPAAGRLQAPRTDATLG